MNPEKQTHYPHTIEDEFYTAHMEGRKPHAQGLPAAGEHAALPSTTETWKRTQSDKDAEKSANGVASPETWERFSPHTHSELPREVNKPPEPPHQGHE